MIYSNMKGVYLTLFLCYMAYAYNRKCVSQSIPNIIEEGLDIRYAGLILSCQNIATSGSKLLFGILSDRINPTRLFAAGLFITGLVTVLFSLSSSVFPFCLFWFLNGLGQGCGWPSLSKILRQTADPTKFGTLWSFLTSSNNISGCLSPFLSAYLALNYGWRYSIGFAGLCSIALSLIPLCLTNLIIKSSHYSQNNKKDSGKKKDHDSTISTYALLKYPYLWMIFICFLVIFCTKQLLTDWGQLFIIKECGLPLAYGSVFASSVEVGGFLGRLSAGYITDVFVQKNKSHQGKQMPSFQIRLSIGSCFLFGSFCGIHAFRSLTEDSPMWWLMSIGFLSGGFLYGMIAICGVVASECVPSHLSGSGYALAAFGGNIGSALSGLPSCYIADLYSWSKVLLLLQILLGLTLIVVLWFKNMQTNIHISKKED